MDFLSILVIRIPAILIALPVHEFSHGFIAKSFGDPTAENEGRLTLNPVAHFDPFGVMMLLFGPFGWAKPVPVNPMYFKNPRQGMALVAAAGPLSNIILAALTGLIFRFFVDVNSDSAVSVFLYVFFIINIGVAVFNLLPVYPLDGSRILMAFLNRNQLNKYMKAMKFVPQIFLGMIIVEWFFNIPVLSSIFKPIFKLAEALFIGI